MASRLTGVPSVSGAVRGGHTDDTCWPDGTRPKWAKVHIEVETTIPLLGPLTA
ncbi:MAG TPA: hypothetical protein VFO67_19860 [Gemmatimonadales bacterium]|nr:hypothetical protein [Gemmatimonadales bacterium]